MELTEEIRYLKKKIGNKVSFYKVFPERGYVVHVDVSRESINRLSLTTLNSNIGKGQKKKIKPIWSDVPVYIYTNTTEKLFNYHFNKVVKNLND